MAVILVADDEEMILHLVSTVLESAGHHVITARNGLEAVSLFRSYVNRIDLVITDIKMPVMDGHQVVRLVRQSDPQAKIICMSGFSEQVPAGVKFLRKPFMPGDLRSCVEHVLVAA